MNPLDNLVLESDQSIRSAMKLLDKNARGILFVIEKQKLIGVATDGDIRRSLLLGFKLGASIKNAMNSKFISLPISADSTLIRKTFNSTLRMIPLCDERGNLVDIADSQRSHRIPLLEPDLSGRELEYVTSCIETNWISSQGAYVHRFEKQFERMHPNTYALAVSNGTVALHLALHALGVKEGDEVIVPDVTFAATINAVFYCNATPVLCEINPVTFCIDIREVEKLITNKTRAVIPVHLYGQMCDMDALEDLAKKYNFLVIEDCAEAIGSRWGNKPAGVFGNAATFSFFGNKTISTGEGGMLLFQDKEVYKKARVLRDHGMTPGKKYWHDQIGFNYRLTNIQAAIGVGQMERLELILEKKINISNLYSKMLINTPGISMLPKNIPKTYHSNWLYTIILNQYVIRDDVIRELLNLGIECRPVFYPLHSMPPYKKLKRSDSLLHSEAISYSGISLPTSVSLTHEELRYICKCLSKILADVVH